MNKFLPVIKNIFLFIVFWFTQCTVIVFFSISLFGGLKPNSMIAFGGIASLYSSYKLVIKTNKSNYLKNIFDRFISLCKQILKWIKDIMIRKSLQKKRQDVVLKKNLVDSTNWIKQEERAIIQNHHKVLFGVIIVFMAIAYYLNYKKERPIEHLFRSKITSHQTLDEFQNYITIVGIDALYFEAKNNTNLSLGKLRDVVRDRNTYRKFFKDYPMSYLELKVNKISNTNNSFAYDTYGNKLGGMKNGKREGEWIEYYDNNTIAIKGNYTNGFMNGFFQHFDEFGILRHEGDYINGSNIGHSSFSGIPIEGRVGSHKFYYLNGKLHNLMNYRNGENIKSEYWHTNGVKMAEYDYIYNTGLEWDENGNCTINEKFE